MRVKSNKALRTSARTGQRAFTSSAVELLAETPFGQLSAARVGATTTVAAAVASILYAAGGTAYAQEAAPAAPHHGRFGGLALPEAASWP